MKMLAFRNRKLFHKILISILILIQILIIIIWYNHSRNENSISNAIDQFDSPNLIFHFANKANNYYHDTQYHFNDYLYSSKPEKLESYKSSVDSLKFYLDSLNILSKNDKQFENIIINKTAQEKEFIVLQKKLDSIVHNGVSPIKEENFNEYRMKKYDFDKVLRSITYDSIRVTDEVIKRGMLARIGNAIAGKYDIQKDELQLYIKMIYEKDEKTGTLEEQLGNIFLATDKYYSNEFNRISNLYRTVKAEDRKLLDINRKLTDYSKSIIEPFINSASLIGERNQSKFIQNFKNNQNIRNGSITFLLILMVITTILLFLFTKLTFTYEKKLNKAKERTQANLNFKNRIIGMISHEIRAPLQIINSKIQSLKESKTKESAESSIESLEFTSRSLLLTANQILDFSKNEHSKIIAYNSKTNLYTDIYNIIESLKSLAKNKNIYLRSELDKELNNDFWVDSGKIHQLFYNLIGNAIKFTDKGGVQVYCEIKESGSEYIFKGIVKDTGIGIPAEDLKHIFDKYYQSGSTTLKNNFGAGLGLHLCKEIVELYQGNLEIESDYGNGSTITFSLKINLFKDTQKSSFDLLYNELNHNEKSVAILDDDLLSITVLKQTLKDLPLSVTTFNSCKTIKEYLKNNKPDIIITDLNLPDGSGWDLASEIKNNPELPDIKIIAVTGDTYWESADAENLPVDEVIIKPINPGEFFCKLSGVFGAKK